MPEPESRGKAPFQEAQDRQASSPEGTAGPPGKGICAGRGGQVHRRPEGMQAEAAYRGLV